MDHCWCMSIGEPPGFGLSRRRPLGRRQDCRCRETPGAILRYICCCISRQAKGKPPPTSRFRAPLPRSSPEGCCELEVRGPHELIDRRHTLEAVSAADQRGSVACKAGRVAGYRDDRCYRRCGERFRLAGGAGARRIEDRSRVAGERIGWKRVAREIAVLDGSPWLVCGGAGERS